MTNLSYSLRHSRHSDRLADGIIGGWEWLSRRAAIGAHSKRAKRFAYFGHGAAICFPPTALFGESSIRIGAGTIIGPYCSLSAGMLPGQELVSDTIVTVGERCIIGRHSSIVGHLSIEIGDDVYLGPNVYVTDQNHSYQDDTIPIGHQSAPEQPVSIGDGSWIGTNAVVLPGVTIGRHAVVAAGSVVSHDVDDHSIVAGVPAKVMADQRDTTRGDHRSSS